MRNRLSLAFASSTVLLLAACGGGAAVDAGTPDGGSPDLAVGDGGTDAGGDAGSPDLGYDGGFPDDAATHHIQTVFVIVMENHNWANISGSSSAPYINSLLPLGAHSEMYQNPPRLHPSEPNYLWMEAGTSFGVRNDDDPATNHQASTDHLATYLEHAGISWKTYQEDIVGDVCPLTGHAFYAPKHNPFVFFDDITDGNIATSTHCITHNRPFTELATDLAAGTVARYNFITPNQCNDMHGATGCPGSDNIARGDTWLMTNLPPILAYASTHDGAVFITWDESELADAPIGMIVLGPYAKVDFTESTTAYTHGSLLRTLQDIFNVGPYLADAGRQESLANLFAMYP